MMFTSLVPFFFLLLQATMVAGGAVLPRADKGATRAVVKLKDDKSGVRGTVKFTVAGGKTTIEWDLSGNEPNSERGIHIHELGNSTDCAKLGGHYNPFNDKHGGPKDKVRHIGDLGNFKTDSKGNSKGKMTSSVVKLSGEMSVIGRSIVIHGGKDDFGKGGTPDSATTGNAGPRLACAQIKQVKSNNSNRGTGRGSGSGNGNGRRGNARNGRT